MSVKRWALLSADGALLLLYPVAWSAPLATAGMIPWLGGNQISILSGVSDLWAVDPALSVLVGLLAVVLPYVKTLALVAIHLEHLGPRAIGWIEALGRLSMADVFLIAMWVVVVKGVGIGHVTPAWGLWLFTTCVLTGIATGWATKQHFEDRPQ